MSLNKKPDGTSKITSLSYDDQPVFRASADPADDPTELARQLIERALPDRATTEAFDFSIGVSLSPEDRKLFGETTTRIALYDLRVEPNNFVT